MLTEGKWFSECNSLGKCIEDTNFCTCGIRKRFLPGAQLVYRPGTSSGDYNGKLNSNYFEKWIQNQILPNLPEGPVMPLWVGLPFRVYWAFVHPVLREYWVDKLFEANGHRFFIYLLTTATSMWFSWPGIKWNTAFEHTIRRETLLCPT